MPLTFSGLRGDLQPRQWYRRSDLIAAAVALGVPFGEWEVRKAIRGLPKPTEKRYGHLHYSQAHMDAVVRAAKIVLDAEKATDVPYAAPRSERCH